MLGLHKIFLIMKASLKFHILKVSFILWYLLFVFAAVKAWSFPIEECGEIPFSTEITSYEKVGDCYQVVLEVTHDNTARYELSHANFYFSCGTITNASNSQGWKMEFLKKNHKNVGIKVDDIQNFGKDIDFTSFQVEFTYCPSNPDDMECSSEFCQPKVAYKAGQCIYMEDLNTDDNTTPPSALNYAINATSPSCAGNDGMIEITVTEGTEPYIIEWAHGATGNLLEELSAGTYLFILKDGAGNEKTDEIILESSDSSPFIESTITEPACMGISNGSIVLSVTGGIAPYTFLWNTGSTEQNLTELIAGAYSVEVTDSKGCKGQASFTLANQSTIRTELAVTQPSCQEGTLGSISITPSGGTAPYMISWSNELEGSTIDQLVDGNYDVTITDASGCEYKRRIPIQTEIGFDVTASATMTNCLNEAQGSIDLIVAGGTEPFTYSWSNGETSKDIDNLVYGSYTVIVTDGKGCQKTLSSTVLKDNISIGYDAIIQPSCYGSNDGSIDISVSNGTEPYTYSWSTGATTQDVDNLSGGKYNLIVSDDAGCSIEKSINLPEPSEILIDYEIVQDACSGQQTILVTGAGGNSDYTIDWNEGSSGNELTDVTPGTYTVTYTDGNQCSATKEIIVEDFNPQLSCAIADLNSDVLCGTNSNTIESSVTDADFYRWALTSSDDSWTITSASDQQNIQFTSGSAGSTATFLLTLGYAGGCEISCKKVIEVCIDNPDDNPDGGVDTGGDNPDDGTGSDNPDGGSTGGDNPDGGSNGGDQPDCENPDAGGNPGVPGDNENANDGNQGQKDCDECFYSNPIKVAKTDEGYQFTIEVSHNACNYDLSHLTIEIPDCYTILDYSNNMNWKMVKVNDDPTTELSGIKIDDIPSFGKEDGPASFEIYIELMSDQDCAEDLKCFEPVIAYKAATCIYEEITENNCEVVEEVDHVTTYPNPTCDYVNIDKKSWDQTASYTADLRDFNGERIKSFEFKKGSASDFEIDMTSCKQGLYILQIKSSKGHFSTHRVVKY